LKRREGSGNEKVGNRERGERVLEGSRKDGKRVGKDGKGK